MVSVWDEMRRMQEQMDLAFDNFFKTGPFTANSMLEGPKSKEIIDYKNPTADVWETEKEVMAEIDIPGVDKKDIKVEVDDSGIEIKAETKSEVEQKDKKKGLYKLERNYSGFYRKISLPNNVDSSNAKAEYKNGVLKISVPKTKAITSKKKQLEIK